MPTVLLTGIEPFDGETINPSWEAARRLDGAVIGGATARQLPCVLSEVLDRLHGALEETRPDLVVCLGQASGRSDVSVERVAINLVDARIPDNAGRQPIDEPVIAGGPGAYFSTLPVKAIVRALRQGGVPASASLTAGTSTATPSSTACRTTSPPGGPSCAAASCTCRTCRKWRPRIPVSPAWRWIRWWPACGC